MRQSDEGRLYFQFGVGAEILFKPDYCAEFVYTIIDCVYENDCEYYVIGCEGKQLPRILLKDFEMVLDSIPCEMTVEGEPVELPLLIDEVKIYFDDRRKQLNAENAEANKALKNSTYYELIGERSKLRRKINLLRAEGKEQAVAKEEGALDNLEKQIDKTLDDLGIDRRTLHKTPTCAECKDSGIIDGEICGCAYKRQEVIKAYAARLRIEKGSFIPP